MKRWWVKLLLGIGAIVFVLLAWLANSSIHSKNSVDRYKDQLRAAGEKLTLNELMPTPADPEKNGAALFLQATSYMSAYSGVIYTNPPPAMRMVAPGKAMVGWQQSELLSVEGSRFITNTWADLEQDLSNQDSALDLLRKAAERPKLDFELDYNLGMSVPFTHLIKVKESAMMFSAATVSDLNRGDTVLSVTDLHSSLALINAWQERTLISQLVPFAMVVIDASAQWEVLQATNLTDAELAKLQNDWQAMEIVPPIEKAFCMERAWSSLLIQQLRSSNNPSGVFSSPGIGAGSGAGGLFDDLKDMAESAKRKTSDTLWRDSWSYSDELRVLQQNQVMVETARQIETNGFFKDALTERLRKIRALGLTGTNGNWLRNKLDDPLLDTVVVSGDSFSRVFDRMLTIQASQRIVIAAIALKRYRLRHTGLPPNLSALVPEFLSEVPHDPVDGQPLRYRLNPDNTFVLYSIGADAKDDGGDTGFPATSKTFYWLRGRDWVWPQPATADEVQDYYDNSPK